MSAPLLDCLPDPDYDRHGAYGRMFGRPDVGTRLRAIGRCLPYIGLYAAYGMIAGKRMAKPGIPGAEPLQSTLERDGSVCIRLAPESFERLQVLFEPLVDLVRAKRAGKSIEWPVEGQAHAHHGSAWRALMARIYRRLNGTGTANELIVHESDAPEVFSALRETLNEHGVLQAAHGYQGRPLDVRVLKILVNQAQDSWWRARLADADVPDPQGLGWHVDHLWTTKCILYLSRVNARSGPFSYCLGSHQVPIGYVEGVIRRAVDRAGLASCEPERRRLFAALPKWMRKKAEFGYDLEDDHPMVPRLLASEQRYTSEDGDLVVFDDKGIHRGGQVEEGERVIVQIRLA